MAHFVFIFIDLIFGAFSSYISEELHDFLLIDDDFCRKSYLYPVKQEVIYMAFIEFLIVFGNISLQYKSKIYKCRNQDFFFFTKVTPKLL